MRSGAVKRVMVLPSNLLRGGSMLALDMIQTLAAGGVALFVGFAVVRRFPVLARYNVPAAVIRHARHFLTAGVDDRFFHLYRL